MQGGPSKREAELSTHEGKSGGVGLIKFGSKTRSNQLEKLIGFRSKGTRGRNHKRDKVSMFNNLHSFSIFISLALFMMVEDSGQCETFIAGRAGVRDANIKVGDMVWVKETLHHKEIRASLLVSVGSLVGKLVLRMNRLQQGVIINMVKRDNRKPFA